MPRFARRVWWAGHVQLFVAAAVVPASVAVWAVGLATPELSAFTFYAVLGLAMVAPFVCSGLMLRSFAGDLALDSTSTWFRVFQLVLVVLGIAVTSIGFVFFDVFVLLLFLGGLVTAF
ncbi:hypothetical protein ACRAWB_04035 [Leifsonia poae]|uniref:hypothetical protein n=1 Tax=Leifsonia poae TaxID=110933 RepID=UPI003D6817B2